MNHSRWLKCISSPGQDNLHGHLRGVVVQATKLVADLVKLHALTGKQAQGLGEAIVSALLISSYCKPGERVNLNIDSSGPVKQAFVDAYPDGTARGYVAQQRKPTGTEKLSQWTKERHRGFWQEGTLSVLRSRLEEKQQPYVGTVPLMTGDLAQDLDYYWHQSEQVPSGVGLYVEVDEQKVVAAGGILIQLIPQANPTKITSHSLRTFERVPEITLLERHRKDLLDLTKKIVREPRPLELLEQTLENTVFTCIEERNLGMHCNCSFDRVRRALALVGVSELKEMLAMEQQVRIRCDFCTKEYLVDAIELKQLIRSYQLH